MCLAHVSRIRLVPEENSFDVIIVDSSDPVGPAEKLLPVSAYGKSHSDSQGSLGFRVEDLGLGLLVCEFR